MKSRSIKKGTKKELQYTAILIKQAWSKRDLLYGQKENLTFFLDQRGKSQAGKMGPSCPLG